MLFSYDKTLGTVETSQGTMTLTKVFIPFFLEMFFDEFHADSQYLYALLFFG